MNDPFIAMFAGFRFGQEMNAEFKRRLKGARLKKPKMKEPIVMYQEKNSSRLRQGWEVDAKFFGAGKWLRVFPIAKWKIYLK